MLRSILAAGLACLLGACAQQAARPVPSAASPAPHQASIATGSDVVLISAKGNNVTIHTVPEGKVRVDADADKVDVAFQLVKDGKLKAAMEPLDEVIDHYESRYGHGDMAVYSAHGDTDALVYAMLVNLAGKSKETIVFGPAWAMAYWMRGYIYGEMNQFDEEIRELDKALALAPMDPQYNNELAFVYAQKREFAKAMELYGNAQAHAEFAPTPALANLYKCVSLRGKGYVLVELHKLDEAEASYRECLKITPDEPKSLAEIGYIQGLRKKQH